MKFRGYSNKHENIYRFCPKPMIYFRGGVFMKNFMQTNTVTQNLMSFSAFKGMYIFSQLIEGPKTYEQIKSALENHDYLRETISIDTIRIYFNSLRKLGCNIKRVTKDRKAHYYIDSHPFELKIDDNQANAIIKVYKAISKSIDFSDYMALTGFFEKISSYVKNEKLKTKLLNISPLSNIDSSLIKDLEKCVANCNEITIYYNSPNSGPKNIVIITDKLYIDNGKLYLSGFNSEHKNYSSFLVSRIIKIVSINFEKPKLSIPDYRVVYEYKKVDNKLFEPVEGEKILSETEDKIVVEYISKNKFLITQRILSHTTNCKIISPTDFKKEIITCLRQMKEGYFEK